MNAKEYEQIVKKELIMGGNLFDQLHNAAMKMLKPRWETDLCLKEFNYESLKIKENHLKYSAKLSIRVKVIKEKKIEILKLTSIFYLNCILKFIIIIISKYILL